MNLKAYVLCFFICFATIICKADTLTKLDDVLTNHLIELGFENVEVVIDANDLVIYFQNEIYRDDFFGIAKVINVLQHVIGRSTRENFEITLIPLTHRIALHSFQFSQQDLANLTDGTITTSSFFENVQFCEFEQKPTLDFANSSLWKFDFLLQPQIALQLGNYDDRMKIALNINPGIQFSPWSGAEFLAQYSIPIVNEFFWQDKEFAIDKARIDQFFKFPFKSQGMVSAGLLGQERWGLCGELNRYFFQHKAIFGIKYAYTGAFFTQNKEIYYSELNVETLQIYADYNWVAHNLLLGVSFNKFLMQDQGWRFDISRFYKEIKVNAFLGITDIDKFFGFALKIPFRSFQSAPRKHLRLTVPDYYNWGYQATNYVYTRANPVQTGVVLNEHESLRERFYQYLPGYFYNNAERVGKEVQMEP